jgi:hypothetical protein
MWWSATTCSFRLTGSLSLYVVSIAYALTNADNTCSLVRLSAAENTHFVFATQSAMLGRESYVTKHQVLWLLIRSRPHCRGGLNQ